MARDVLSSVTSTDHQGIETLSYSELEKLIDFFFFFDKT